MRLRRQQFANLHAGPLAVAAQKAEAWQQTMKTLIDSTNALVGGLAAIRQQFGVPDDFPPDVVAAAEAAVRRAPVEHVDRTNRAFVTLDPATSMDLDQAFTIERSGSDLLLH